MPTPADIARQELERIKAKYTRPDEQRYLRLLVAAWEYHIRILEQEAMHHDD